ncbi:MAG: hypothetical protein Ta2F_05960 [Termitinemataceae bacterium]|nr:MAG: hypothetical protein Ta2F_05960 [Termitinemataceae bacterium]
MLFSEFLLNLEKPKNFIFVVMHYVLGAAVLLIISSTI